MATVLLFCAALLAVVSHSGGALVCYSCNPCPDTLTRENLANCSERTNACYTNTSELNVTSRGCLDNTTSVTNDTEKCVHDGCNGVSSRADVGAPSSPAGRPTAASAPPEGRADKGAPSSPAGRATAASAPPESRADKGVPSSPAASPVSPKDAAKSAKTGSGSSTLGVSAACVLLCSVLIARS